MKNPITLRYRLGNERDFLEKKLSTEGRMTLKRTNYSLKVETDRRNYLFTNQSSVGKRSFGAYQKILKDIKASGIVTPELTSRDVKYWWFKEKANYPSNFYSIDINSAYPSVLYNVGAITEETYIYLTTKIPKIDRLRCVGMLATNKGVYHYEDGKLVDFEQETSDLAGWFYLCCYMIGEIMDEVKRRYKNTAIYYWVDGIAVSEDPWDVLCFIEHLGYQSKIEQITNCRLVNNWLCYDKDGKKKYLHLPKKVNISDADARRFLEFGNFK
jgi:hypothetical protein